MDDLRVFRKVFFVGAWRAQTITDHLLRQISAQMSSKKGYPTTINVTAEGLELFILNANGKTTRTEKIPLQNIVNLVDNKYSSSCLLAIVKDENVLFTVFGFLVSSRSDIDEMIYTIREAKRRLKGKNWTLVSKTSSTSQSSAPVHVRVETQPSPQPIAVNGASHVGSSEVKYQIMETRARPINDDTSITTNATDVRDELASLTKEVRDIKLMLQNSKGEQPSVTYHDSRQVQWEPSNPLEVTTNAKFRIYDDIAEQRPSVKQTIYQKNARYANRSANPGYVVQNDFGRGRTDSVGQRSYVSTSSADAWYSRGHYDPGTQRSFKQRPAVMRIVKGSKTKIVPHVLVRKSKAGHYSDTVRKNIEDVYKPRSLRRTGAVPVMVNPQQGEYLLNIDAPPSTSTEMNGDDTEKLASATVVYENRAVTTAETDMTKGNAHFVKVETSKEIHPHNDHMIDVKVSDEETRYKIESQSSAITDSSEESSNVLETSQTTIDRHLELIDTLVDDENADYEPVSFERSENIDPDTTVHVVTEETHIVHHTGDIDYTEYTEHSEETQTTDNAIQKEVTFDVKTEIITSKHEEDEYDVDEEERHVIVPHKVVLYHDDEGNEITEEEHDVEFRKVDLKDSRRVRYMTELNQNITQKMGMFEDSNNNENSEIEEEQYVLDEEMMKRFSAEPNIVIITKEEESTVKPNVNGDIKAYESAELDLDIQRGENTVLF